MGPRCIVDPKLGVIDQNGVPLAIAIFHVDVGQPAVAERVDQPNPLPIGTSAGISGEVNPLRLGSLGQQSAMDGQTGPGIEEDGCTRLDGQRRAVGHGQFAGDPIGARRGRPSRVGIDRAGDIRHGSVVIIDVDEVALQLVTGAVGPVERFHNDAIDARAKRQPRERTDIRRRGRQPQIEAGVGAEEGIVLV